MSFNVGIPGTGTKIGTGGISTPVGSVGSGGLKTPVGSVGPGGVSTPVGGVKAPVKIGNPISGPAIGFQNPSVSITPVKPPVSIMPVNPIAPITGGPLPLPNPVTPITGGSGPVVSPPTSSKPSPPVSIMPVGPPPASGNITNPQQTPDSNPTMNTSPQPGTQGSQIDASQQPSQLSSTIIEGVPDIAVYGAAGLALYLILA